MLDCTEVYKVAILASCDDHASNLLEEVPGIGSHGIKLKAITLLRFAIGACSLQDLAQGAHVKAILAPTPKSVDRNRACRRAYLQRFFEVWRAHTAQHASKSRRACNFPQHLLITSSAQFSGQSDHMLQLASHTGNSVQAGIYTNQATTPPINQSNNHALFDISLWSRQGVELSCTKMQI